MLKKLNVDHKSFAAKWLPLETPRLLIFPFETRHLTDRYVSWLNDPDVVRYSEQRHHVHTHESCKAYFEGFRNSEDLFLALEMREGTNGHIGNVSIAVDVSNLVADISILIGEKSVWGKGIGLEAWTCLLRALLQDAGMRKVTGGAVEANCAMIAIMRKSGMLEDGCRKAHALVDGNPKDILHFAAFSMTNQSKSG